jgi:hypothetical protein
MSPPLDVGGMMGCSPSLLLLLLLLLPLLLLLLPLRTPSPFLWLLESAVQPAACCWGARPGCSWLGAAAPWNGLERWEKVAAQQKWLRGRRNLSFTLSSQGALVPCSLDVCGVTPH